MAVLTLREAEVEEKGREKKKGNALMTTAAQVERIYRTGRSLLTVSVCTAAQTSAGAGPA